MFAAFVCCFTVAYFHISYRNVAKSVSQIHKYMEVCFILLWNWLLEAVVGGGIFVCFHFVVHVFASNLKT